MRPTQVNLVKVENGFIVEVINRNTKEAGAFVYATLDEAIGRVKEELA